MGMNFVTQSRSNHRRGADCAGLDRKEEKSNDAAGASLAPVGLARSIRNSLCTNYSLRLFIFKVLQVWYTKDLRGIFILKHKL